MEGSYNRINLCWIDRAAKTDICCPRTGFRKLKLRSSERRDGCLLDEASALNGAKLVESGRRGMKVTEKDELVPTLGTACTPTY
jgi:hypothetical protein